MAEENKISRVKTKKKRWFPIFSPGFLGQKEVGETYLAESQEALGRLLKINLRDLTGSFRDQNIYVSLKIKEVKGNNLYTEVTSYEYTPSFIRKVVRRDIGKIDDSFLVKTKDNKTVRVKPLTLSVFSTKNSVKTAIRKELRKLLKEEVEKLDFDSLINDFLKYRLQTELKKKLNKISPVKDIIMRIVKLEAAKYPEKAKEVSEPAPEPVGPEPVKEEPVKEENPEELPVEENLPVEEPQEEEQKQ